MAQKAATASKPVSIPKELKGLSDFFAKRGYTLCFPFDDIRRPGYIGKFSEGNDRLTAVTPTKSEADKFAREIARNQGTEIVIHDRHGVIRNKDSFGNDPCPPRDKKH